MNPAVLTLLALSAPPAPAPAPAAAPSVAVFPLTAKAGFTQAQADVLADPLYAAVRDSGVFPRTVGPRDLDVLIGSLAREQIAKCAQDQCSVVDDDLAGALGVSHLVVGSVGRLGDSVVLSLMLLELRTGQTKALHTEQFKGGDEQLVPRTTAAVTVLLRRAGFATREPAEEKPASTLKYALMGAGGAAAVAAVPSVLVVAGLVGVSVFALASLVVRNSPLPPVLLTGLRGDTRNVVANVWVFGPLVLVPLAVLTGVVLLGAGGALLGVGATR